ncbi:MAG: 2-alkenal reductase [Verrucomicrobiales bacterium]|nr:2-alkenal reductase [Verrucomicrobiales bacterium]
MQKTFSKIVGLVAVYCFVFGAMRFTAKADTDVRRDPIVQAVEKVKESLVNISTKTMVPVQDPFQDFFGQFFGPSQRSSQRYQESFSLGSGVIINEDGYILSNNHVVQRANQIQITVGTNLYNAKLIAASPTVDVALLKIEAKRGEKFHAMKFARDDDVLLGETVIALGNPFGLGFSVSRGILSSTTRRPETEKGPLDYKDWLQTDAAINPGNSGGALIDIRGELIGLNVAVFRDQNAQGIGFAIPIKRVAEALSDIFTPEESNQQLWFGVKINSNTNGLLVANIEPGSPADKAGLKKGDTVVQVGEKAPRNFIEFVVEVLSRSQKQADVPLVVTRGGGERFNINVHLVPQKTVFNADLIRKKIGATFQEITPDLQQYLNLPARQGFIVAGVDPNSPAEKAGLERGLLINAIDHEPAGDILDAAKILYNKKANDSVEFAVTALRQVRGNLFQMQQGTITVKLR